MNARSINLFCALIAVLATPASARDLRFAELFKNVVDGEILVETNPGDVLVLDGGTFSTNGLPLTVVADTLRIDRPTLILSYNLDSAPGQIAGRAGTGPTGQTGGGWGCRDVEQDLLVPSVSGGGMHISLKRIKIKGRACALEGQIGGPGDTGAVGAVGAAGSKIEIRAAAITGTSLLVVAGNGQKGGSGQQGGKGGTGGLGIKGDNRAGDVLCDGQNSRLDGSQGGGGGPGGKGGPGGGGGIGSQIVIAEPFKASLVQLDTDTAYDFIKSVSSGTTAIDPGVKILAFSVGGRGGDGGPGGPGGDAGQGGDGGKHSHCGGGGNPGAPGPLGVVGPEGDHGPDGVPAQ